MKKSALVLVLAALTTGCATTKRMDYQDLNHYKIDCANKEAQVRFLESQLATPYEQAAASANVFAVFDGSRPEKKAIADRRYNAVARNLLWDIRTYCP